jgi:hypothetical protein
MTVKVLVTTTGQQIISEVKQVENKETKEVIAYWLVNPRVITYSVNDDDQVNVGFGSFCLVSNETEFSLKADFVVSILEARPEVLDRYSNLIAELTPADTEESADEDAVEPEEEGGVVGDE